MIGSRWPTSILSPRRHEDREIERREKRGGTGNRKDYTSSGKRHVVFLWTLFRIERSVLKPAEYQGREMKVGDNMRRCKVEKKYRLGDLESARVGSTDRCDSRIRWWMWYCRSLSRRADSLTNVINSAQTPAPPRHFRIYPRCPSMWKARSV